MYIDDCLHGTRALMESDIIEPINIGSSEMVTINQLVELAEEIVGHQGKAESQPRRSERCPRPQQRQYLYQEQTWLGAIHAVANRS